MADKVDAQTAARHDADIEAWFARYGSVPERAYAESVDFNLQRRVMILCMSNSHRVELPLDDIQGLAFASSTQLREFEMLAGARAWTGLRWACRSACKGCLQARTATGFGWRRWSAGARSLNRSASRPLPARMGPKAPAQGEDEHGLGEDCPKLSQKQVS